jgi:hypothetical protein
MRRHHLRHHHRPAYRRRRGRLGPLPVLIIALLLLWTGPRLLEALAISVAAMTGLLFLLASVAVIMIALKINGYARRRRVAAPTRPSEARKDRVADKERKSWASSKRSFEALRAEYGGYECDPLAVLRLPALADVSVASTGRFVDAFAAAQALDTDEEPPAAMAAEYQRAVDAAWRAWRAATDAAERIRLAGLSPEERSTVQRVVKLLTMAEKTGHDAERHAAYAKAREELARLERAGQLRMPTPAMAALDEAARAGLTTAPDPASG